MTKQLQMKMKFSILIIVLHAIFPSLANNANFVEVNIGAIFFKDELDLMIAFDTAIADINALEAHYHLNAFKHFLSEDDSTLLQQLTCDLLDKRVAAIFGPSSTATSDIVEVMSNMTGIPHFQFDWRSDESDMLASNYFYTVNLAPSERLLSTALYDILRTDEALKWKSFTIVYEEGTTDLTRMQNLFGLLDIKKNGIKLVKFQRGEDYRITWKIVKNSREKNILLDCPPDILTSVINASVYYNMTKSFNSFLITNLDTHLSDIGTLYSKNFSATIKGIRLLPYVPPAMHAEIDVFAPEEEETIVTLKAQCLYDAVVLFFNSLQQLFGHFQDIDLQTQFSCNRNYQPWGYGTDLMEKIKNINPKVVKPHFKTQKVSLSNRGVRNDFNLELYNPLTERHFFVWNKNKGLKNSTKVLKKNNFEEKVDFSQKKPKYVVATRFGAPYFKYRHEPEGVHFEGNERFEGYVVDLIYKLSEKCEFDFVFEPVADNKYGSYNELTDDWDGIVRQIIDNHAQMGICDLTITQSRKQVVDFTVPFMTLGIQILHTKPVPAQKGLFEFLGPYSVEVWFYILVTILVWSLVFVVLARLSPSEWKLDVRNKNDTVATLQWSLRNSLHLHISSILNVGCDILPASFNLRLFTTFYWVFSILIAQTYLAQMAAFITASKLGGSIENLHDLVHQDKIQFGTIKGGATSMYFSESNESDYRLAYNKMKSFKPEAYTLNNEEGVERVKRSKGKYAFLIETPNLKYYVERNCELTAVGDAFSEKLYGIAVPLNANYRSVLSVGILQLAETGVLFNLTKKWFHNETQTCEFADAKPGEDSGQVDMHMIGGLFVVLIAGIFVAIFIAIGEFFWNVNKIAVKHKIPPKVVLKAEFRFFLRFWQERKVLKAFYSTDVNSNSRGSLLPPSTATTTDSGEKEKRKKVKRKRKVKKEEV